MSVDVRPFAWRRFLRLPLKCTFFWRENSRELSAHVRNSIPNMRTLLLYYKNTRGKDRTWFKKGLLFLAPKRKTYNMCIYLVEKCGWIDFRSGCRRVTVCAVTPCHIPFGGKKWTWRGKTFTFGYNQYEYVEIVRNA